LIYPAETLAKQNNALTVYFYNPNIHPFSEFSRRREALRTYCAGAGLSVVESVYDYRNHLTQAISAGTERCAACYRIRLMKTAQFAAAEGFEAFTTTLLVSPYQQHEELKAAGEEAAAKHGVPFFYEDWRCGFREGRAKARELGLYSQKYCGCLFSEEERANGVK
jgi:hypothetical protein